MFWFTLIPENMNDDHFWVNLRKLLICAKKGSGRIVFHMPRKSRSWNHEGVKAILDSYGLRKVTFTFGNEKITVATNEEKIRDFLNPHVVAEPSATCSVENPSSTVPP